MNRATGRRLAAAAAVVVGFAATAIAPAGATGQRAGGWVRTNCHKEYEVDAAGGIAAFANGNGYGEVSWEGHTAIRGRRYWNDAKIQNKPDRSCDYGHNFLQLDWEVKQGDRHYDGGWGQVDDSATGTRGMQEYPPEGVGYSWEGTHLWGADEQQWCDYYWIFKSHGDAEVPHYTPHPPEDGLSAVDGPTMSASPLITSVESTYVDVDISALQPVVSVERPGPITIRYAGPGPRI